MDTPIFTNCLCCGQFVTTTGYEPFYCASKRDTGTIIKASKITYDEVYNKIKEGSYVGCGTCLIPYRSGNMHRTRRVITSEAELNEMVKKYNPEILTKRPPTRENLILLSHRQASTPIDIPQLEPNHANQFTESDPK